MLLQGSQVNLHPVTGKVELGGNVMTRVRGGQRGEGEEALLLRLGVHFIHSSTSWNDSGEKSRDVCTVTNGLYKANQKFEPSSKNKARIMSMLLSVPVGAFC